MIIIIISGTEIMVCLRVYKLWLHYLNIFNLKVFFSNTSVIDNIKEFILGFLPVSTPTDIDTPQDKQHKYTSTPIELCQQLYCFICLKQHLN
jgi:hypothetical protein